jgi:hypothetical protein
LRQGLFAAQPRLPQYPRMRKILLAALLGACCVANAAAADDSRLWAYKYVLATSEHPREFATIVTHIENEPELRQVELLDYLAEVLWTNAEKDERVDLELTRMLARCLKKYGGPRYVAVFRKVRRNSLPQSSIRTITDGYLHDYQATTTVQYVPGTVNLPALREQFLADALAAQPTEEQARKMAALPVNANFDALISQIGKPQYIGSGQLRLGERILIDVHIQKMTFYYRGLGRVQFQYKNGIGWLARDREVDPEAFEDLMPYRERAGQLALPGDEAVGFAQLLSGHAMAVKFVAESRTLHGGATPLFMDAAAQVLLENHKNVLEPRMVDAYAWICRLLLTNGGPRYLAVLNTVAENASSEKLQKFAGLEFEKSAPTTGDPYVPGSVALADLRAKYPPLYPQRVLTSSGFRQ